MGVAELLGVGVGDSTHLVSEVLCDCSVRVKEPHGRKTKFFLNRCATGHSRVK